MSTTRRASLWVSCLLVLSASAAFAQTDPGQPPAGPPPAHLSIIEGQAYIDREGRSDQAIANVPLLDGDRLRTLDGRLEVILPDGSLLHVDRDTTVDVLATDLLRLLQGRVYVFVRGARDPQRAVRYQIDAPVASVQTGGPGEFRVWSAEAAQGREVELAVFRGQATLASNYGAEDVRAGERSIVRDGLAPSAPQYFNSARWDEFDRWSAARRDERLGTVSVQYLPSDLTVYASTFDQYGTWRYDQDEGAVWYPTVAVGWRPYSVGYWRTYPSWGSFWIGGDPWGWPTHHYGYWGFSISFGWYWRPAPIWGPAWVSWAYSPGYVSWCPLGRHGYPVFGHFGVRGHYYGDHVDPWRGWTVMPRRHFGSSMPVHRVAVDGRRLNAAARGAFAAGRPASGLDRAVPRPGAGGLAVPRYAGGGNTSTPRASVGAAAPRAGGAVAARPGVSATPRAGGSRARPTPGEAARVLADGGSRASGTATRRMFPAAPAAGSSGQRTAAPAATPDVTAFGSRRNPPSEVPRDSGRTGAPAQFGNGAPGQVGNNAPARFGNGAPAQFGNGAPARFGNGAPAQFGNGAPAQFGNGAPAQFGGGARARTYPRANPPSAAPSPDVSRRRGSWPDGARPAPSSAPSARPGGWSQTPPVRANPYIRGNAGSAGAGESRAYPRSAAPAAPSAPRESPSMRGGGGRTPAPSAGPRGGGMPAGPAMRPGGAAGSSAAPSAPRYNSGSGASRSRGGGASSPPPRGRGGNPD